VSRLLAAVPSDLETERQRSMKRCISAAWRRVLGHANSKFAPEGYSTKDCYPIQEKSCRFIWQLGSTGLWLRSLSIEIVVAISPANLAVT
jgi:hypothetical protein